MNIVLYADALRLIGLIVAQWRAMETILDWQICFQRSHSAIPEDLRLLKMRIAFKSRVSYLNDLVHYSLSDARPEALPNYLKTLSRITNYKGVRDALVHGTYNLQQNGDPEKLVVFYKHKTITISLSKLIETADGIGRCSGFFLDFNTWCTASQHLDAHYAWLSKFHEQGHPQNMILTAHEPESLPESSLE